MPKKEKIKDDEVYPFDTLFNGDFYSAEGNLKKHILKKGQKNFLCGAKLQGMLKKKSLNKEKDNFLKEWDNLFIKEWVNADYEYCKKCLRILKSKVNH